MPRQHQLLYICNNYFSWLAICIIQCIQDITVVEDVQKFRCKVGAHQWDAGYISRVTQVVWTPAPRTLETPSQVGINSDDTPTLLFPKRYSIPGQHTQLENFSLTRSRSSICSQYSFFPALGCCGTLCQLSVWYYHLISILFKRQLRTGHIVYNFWSVSLYLLFLLLLQFFCVYQISMHCVSIA